MTWFLSPRPLSVWMIGSVWPAPVGPLRQPSVEQTPDSTVIIRFIQYFLCSCYDCIKIMHLLQWKILRLSTMWKSSGISLAQKNRENNVPTFGQRHISHQICLYVRFLVYVDASDSCNELAFTLGEGSANTVTSRSWRIKVSMNFHTTYKYADQIIRP